MNGDALEGDEEWGPSFLVPPPPPPSPGSCAELFCLVGGGGPMGAHSDRAQLPALPIIAVCSSVVLVAVLVASFLLWRHKTKVQNLLPCKNEQQGHLGDLGAANGVTYEDVLINHHPTRIPQGHLAGSQNLMPLEILDVKLGDIGPSPISALHTTFYPNRDPSQVMGVKPFHPVYEEVSQAPSGDKSTTGKSYESDFEESGRLGGRSLTSEDDFAEDEFPSGEGSGQCSATSSVRGSTGGDLCRDPVSSDEGTGEDCDFMTHDLPEMLTGDSAFNYPRNYLIRSDKFRGNPTQPPRNVPTYPHPDRTASILPPIQRQTDAGLGGKLHSMDSKKHKSPSHIPSNANSNSNPPSIPWMVPHDVRINFPPGGPSQENIYSTIDEDELTDYPVHSSLTSLACSQRGSPGSGAFKNVPARGDRAVPPLSQRSADDNGSSYGDIMPAFNSASFT